MFRISVLCEAQFNPNHIWNRAVRHTATIASENLAEKKNDISCHIPI